MKAIVCLLALYGFALADDAKPRRIAGVSWHRSLEDARRAAAKPRAKPRPVLWLRMLGDLAGKT